MDFGAIAQSIADQFVTVWNAPVPFLGVCVALWLLLRWHINGQFETRLANAQSTIEMLEKQLDRGQAKAALAEPGPNVPQPPETEPRDISIVSSDNGKETIEKLMELYRGHTDLQAAEIMKQFYGNKLTVTGVVENVREMFSAESVMVILTIDEQIIFCSFSEATDQLQALRKKDKVTIEGQIKVIENSGVEIANCKLL